MPLTIRTKYIVYNHSGTGIRHHTNAQNTVHNFPDNQAEPDEIGDRTASGPESYVFNGQNLPFAFMSVTGTKDGNKLYFNPGDYTYNVGNQDISILVVFAPQGGVSGVGGPGVWVDAFNGDTGQLSDDLSFISILTPPTPPDNQDAPKTHEANQDGVVTTNAAEHLRANYIIDSTVPFVEWKQIMPTQKTVNSRDFTLSKSETGEIWIAFYLSPPVPGSRRPDGDSIWQWVDYATMVDGHGGPGPTERLSGLVREFAVGIALAKTAGMVNSRLRGELLDVASKQIGIATELIQGKLKQNLGK